MTSDAGVDRVDAATVANPHDETPITVQEAAPEVTRVQGSIADLTTKMEVRGKVVKVDLAGAMVDLGLEQPGFLHISQLSTKRVNNVIDVVKEGDEVTAYVLELDKEKGRIILTLIKPPALTWAELREMANKVVKGTVVRLEKFGAFIDIGAERPGLVHVSELADEYVGSPDAVVKVGDQVEVKIIGVDLNKKQIDLSMKSFAHVIEDEEEDGEEELTAMAIALRRAMSMSEDQRGKKRRDKKEKVGGVQAEILARTLQMQNKR
jgi:small subunit ribosomal protein S1